MFKSKRKEKNYSHRPISCLDAFTSLLSEIYVLIHSNKYFDAISPEISKEFDTVNYMIQLNKISNYDFRGLIL